MAHTHDVIIIGAGIAGSALALALTQLGLRIALVDKQGLPTPTSQLGLRVSSINVGSERYLNTLGIDFTPLRRGRFKTITVSQAHSIGELHFASSRMGLAYLGTIIENDLLVQQMIARLMQASNATFHWNVIETVQITQDAALLQCQGLSQISAPLIVGADGAHSWLRAQCRMQVDEKSYQQTATVAHVRTEHSHAHTAYQRFLDTGPLAYLPLEAPNECSIVWSSSPAHSAYLAGLNDAAFAHELTRALNYRLGKMELISARAQFPLIMRHAKRYIAPRCAWVGDALHTLHPLAGQGANLGLMDVMSLARTVASAQTKGRDIGNLALLRPFERERRGGNVLMLQAMQLLSQDKMPMPQLRALGMHVCEHVPLLKQAVMRYALGLYGY